MQVRIERAPWPDAPFRTTIVASKTGLSILVEAQGTLNYGRVLKDLVSWVSTRRHYAEVYIATPSDAVAQAGLLAEMKTDGVGLLVVDDNGSVSEQHRARNPALVITPEPTLKYG